MHFCISHCQHFSIFLRGCKQANLSTFRVQRYYFFGNIQKLLKVWAKGRGKV